MSVTMRDGVPVVNVRDFHVYGQDPEYAKFYEGLSETVIEVEYQAHVEGFWRIDAPTIVKDYGYGEVLAQGRSDGWLAVTDPPDLSACDPCYGVEKGEKCADVLRWENFVAEIEQAIDAQRRGFRRGLETALTGSQAPTVATVAVSMTPENERAIETALLGLDYVEEHNDPDSSGVAGEEMADRLVSAGDFLRGLLSQAVRRITSDAVNVSEREANFSTGIPPRRGGIAAPKATLDAEAMRGHDPRCRRIPTVGTDNECDPT